ncbi:hypothetical protein ROZALSC1DRAFT_23503, partial [Rozella allomycis CSF55]
YFPKEVIDEILKYLPQHSFQWLAMMNKSWNDFCSREGFIYQQVIVKSKKHDWPKVMEKARHFISELKINVHLSSRELQKCLNVGPLKNLTSLELLDANLDFENSNILCIYLRKLKKLSLPKGQINAPALRNLCKLEHLEKFSCRNGSFANSKSDINFSFKSLKDFDISNMRISPSIVLNLIKNCNLEKLCIKGINVEIFRVNIFSHLTMLELSNNSDCLSSLPLCCPSLVELHVDSSNSISNLQMNDLLHISTLNIHSLFLESLSISFNDAFSTLSLLPLKNLSLIFCTDLKVSIEEFSNFILEKQQSLETLEFSECEWLTDSLLELLAKLPRLRCLKINRNKTLRGIGLVKFLKQVNFDTFKILEAKYCDNISLSAIQFAQKIEALTFNYV